jgi:deoxyribonuclease-4
MGKQTRQEAVNLTKKRLNELTDMIYSKGLDSLYFCPETMGKINQIGTLEEIADFCKIDKVYIPTIDFGHLNARTLGGIKSEMDYENIISYLISEIGFERTSKMHVHFSKIMYSKGGEVRHLTMEDNVYGPDFEPLARVIKKHSLEPVILSESDGTQAEDAKLMKIIYEEV